MSYDEDRIAALGDEIADLKTLIDHQDEQIAHLSALSITNSRTIRKHTTAINFLWNRSPKKGSST